MRFYCTINLTFVPSHAYFLFLSLQTAIPALCVVDEGAFEGEQLFAVADITEAVWNCQVFALKKDLDQAFAQLRSCEDQTVSEHSTIGYATTR